MKVLSLTCQNYRNLQKACLQPESGVNVLWGENAQGKTNLLEALWLFTGGHSFRGAKDSELVLHGASGTRLELAFFSEEREQTAALQIEGGRRHAFLNEVPLRSSNGLVGHFCAVIFSPEHIALVREGPANRRNFLDAALCQLKPGYVRLLNRYQRLLAQRNALLKDIPRHPELTETLPVWDVRLVQDGLQIVSQRQAYLKQLTAAAAQIYSGLSHGKEQLSLDYQCSAEDLAAALLENRERDIRQGFTSAGPHRDDMEILLDSAAARTYGSQGQKRSIVLALKLAEAQVLEEITGEKPVVLLDDVLSELDGGRQDYLLNHLSDCQVFITCCVPQQACGLHGGGLYQVKNGCVRPERPQTA